MTDRLFFESDFFFSLLYAAGLLWTIRRFCARFFSFRPYEKVFTALVILLYALGETARLTGLLPSALCRLLWSFLLILWVMLVCQGEPYRKFLSAVLPFTVFTLVFILISSFLFCLALLFLHTVRGVPAPLLRPVSADILSLAGILFAMLTVTLLAERIPPLFEDHPPKWYAALSAPLAGTILLLDILMVGAEHGVLFQSNDASNLYGNQLLSYGGNCILSALCLLSALFYVFGMMKLDIEQRQKAQYRSRIRYYQMLSEQYAMQERLRHDMKNHLIVLQRLSADRTWEPLEDYLSRMAQSGGMESPEDVTGNPVLDALLYEKRKEARQHHIHLTCDVHIPHECPVNDFDLCIIFGNLLDNALHGCKEAVPDFENQLKDLPEPVIQVHCQPVRKFLLTKVSNPTKQTSPSPDGIGLMNVRDVVSKYNGTVEITVKDHTFCIFVLLPMNDIPPSS